MAPEPTCYMEQISWRFDEEPEEAVVYGEGDDESAPADLAAVRLPAALIDNLAARKRVLCMSIPVGGITSAEAASFATAAAYAERLLSLTGEMGEVRVPLPADWRGDVSVGAVLRLIRGAWVAAGEPLADHVFFRRHREEPVRAVCAHRLLIRPRALMSAPQPAAPRTAARLCALPARAPSLQRSTARALVRPPSPSPSRASRAPCQ
jgi:hypothetical protein